MDNAVTRREIEDVMRTIGVERVLPIISNSGSPMVKAQELLTLKYSHIIGIRCSAHVLNLLIQDLCKLPTMYNLITNAKIIVNEINGSKKKKGLYNEEWDQYIAEESIRGEKVFKVSLSLPVTTRWYSVQNMLNVLLKAKLVLERLAIKKNLEFSPETKKLIKDDVFWDECVKVKEFLEPLVRGEWEREYRQNPKVCTDSSQPEIF